MKLTLSQKTPLQRYQLQKSPIHDTSERKGKVSNEKLCPNFLLVLDPELTGEQGKLEIKVLSATVVN